MSIKLVKSQVIIKNISLVSPLNCLIYCELWSLNMWFNILLFQNLHDYRYFVSFLIVEYVMQFLFYGTQLEDYTTFISVYTGFTFN